jgi:predicted nucleic acid-binding protein
MPSRAEPTLAIDTSCAIPYLVTSHAAHGAVSERLRGERPALAGHAYLETYALLTRLPGGARVAPADAARLLDANLPVRLFPREYSVENLVAKAVVAGLVGGAVYDALVGAAAADNALPLLTRDLRTQAAYRAVGAEVVLAL